VPFLALYLFFERWQRRPEPLDFSKRNTLIAGVAMVFALGLLPLRLIQEANPDWRLVGWMIAGIVTILTLCAILFAGGWPWLRHFWFPVCFMLVAVPWPVPIEQRLIQSLMHNVAACCVELLSWFGIPAVQQGNVIEVSSGAVGVEEACSGVRSLQTTLMISLFLGEWFCFNATRRIALLFLGMAIAYFCNLGRAFWLVWLSAQHGAEAIAHWHDFAGLLVLAVTLVLLWSVALGLRKFGCQVSASTLPVVLQNHPRRLPRAALISLLVWLLVVELSTELWYRAHESNYAKTENWFIQWPAARNSFRELPIPPATREILHYSDGEAATWQNPSGTRWTMYFIHWLPGRSAAQLAKAHGPEICLPAAGRTMQSDLGVKILQIHGIALPVHSYVFLNRGEPMYVFYALHEEGAATDPRASRYQNMTMATRMQAVLAGRRNSGQRVLEAAILGAPDQTSAESEFAHTLEELIRS
jgi:exosortase